MSKQTAENKEDMVGDITASPASDADVDDECPALVSSDEEVEECPQTPEEMVEKWNEQGSNRDELIVQVKKIREQALGVFLLGLGHVYPEYWITALVEACFLESKERANSLDVMSDRHELATKIFTQIFDANSQVFMPEMRDLMTQMLVMINSVEEVVVDGRIPVDEAILVAMKNCWFKRECERLVRTTEGRQFTELYCGGCSHPICFALLFFYKIGSEVRSW